LTELENEARKTTLPARTIEPHLVFRVPLAPQANSESVVEKLEAVGLHVVSIEPDRAVVAFRDDQDLSEFRDALKVYEAGPSKAINPQTKLPYKSTTYDVFEYVEADQMKLWSVGDRIGPLLAKRSAVIDRASTTTRPSKAPDRRCRRTPG
jgi:hypothetical protein